MMMMFSPLSITAILLVVPMVVNAFGPSTPVFATTSNNKISNNNGITMRLGKNDLKKRRTITNLLDHVVVKGNSVATKEAIETTVMTERTEQLLEGMNWRRRNAMIRKVRNLAVKYDVSMESTFGIPLSRLELEVEASKIATIKKQEKKIYYEKVIKERDVKVAERRAREAGSEGEKIKQAAKLEQAKQAQIDDIAAKEHEIEMEAKMKYDATLANEEDAAAEEDAAKAAIAAKSAAPVPEKKEE